MPLVSGFNLAFAFVVAVVVIGVGLWRKLTSKPVGFAPPLPKPAQVRSQGELTTGGEFNPNKTHISGDSMSRWLNSPVSDDITTVPGVADGNAQILARCGISSVFQLMSVFMSLKGPEVGSVQLCELFYQQLKLYGIKNRRGEIVVAIASKLNNTFPGLYKPQMYVE
jgi:hypothetical protein